MRKVLCLILLVALAGCGRHEKYARVYRGHDKRYYTKTHTGDAGYVYWVYITPDSSASCCSGGNWARATTPPVPTTLVPTGRAVQVEEDEEPADDAVQETEAVSADESTAESSDSGSDGGSSDGGGSDGGGDGGGGE